MGNENTNPPGKYKQPQPVPQPVGNGYPQTGIKTDGVKQRGHGAAVKGYTSRGPLA